MPFDGTVQFNEGDASQGQIQIIKELPVYTNSYGTLYDDDVLFPSGYRGKYIRFLWHVPYSVAVLPILEDGSVVLIETFRHGLRGWSLEVPKGFGEVDAEPEQIACKELLEETGLSAKKLSRIGMSHSSPGFAPEPHVLFFAEGCRKLQEPNLEETETLKAIDPIPSQEIKNLLISNRVTDANTLLLLARYCLII